jgi:hypothetical protein
MYYFDKDKVNELYPEAESLMIPPMKYNTCKSEEKLQKILDSDEYFAEEKIDGMLYMAVKTENYQYLFSRTPSKKTGLLAEKSANVPHIMETLKELPPYTVLLGEIYYPHKTSKDVSTIMGCLPTEAVNRQNSGYGFISYYIHDILYYDNVDLISGKATNWERYQILSKIFDKHNLKNDYVSLAPVIKENFKTRASEIIRSGGEGIVIKKKNAYYEPDKRPQTNYKIKKVDTIDVICTGLIAATKEYSGKDLQTWDYWECDGEKRRGFYYDDYKSGFNVIPVTKPYYYGWVTAIELGCFNGAIVDKIGTVSSGLTDELRESLAVRPDDFIGKVVEIECMSVDKDAHTLRHPIFLRFRDDKSKYDCKAAEIFA